MTTSSNNTAISGLPHSQGASFNSLDSYLAHLRKMGQQDRPFYEEVSPNRYKLNTGRGSARRAVRYFTRDDLMQKFGFSQ